MLLGIFHISPALVEVVWICDLGLEDSEALVQFGWLYTCTRGTSLPAGSGLFVRSPSLHFALPRFAEMLRMQFLENLIVMIHIIKIARLHSLLLRCEGSIQSLEDANQTPADTVTVLCFMPAETGTAILPWEGGDIFQIFQAKSICRSIIHARVRLQLTKQIRQPWVPATTALST